jgi:hypothetical protein
MRPDCNTAAPSLAPLRTACIRLVIGPRRCHLETSAQPHKKPHTVYWRYLPISFDSVPVRTSKKEIGPNGRLPVVGRIARGQSPTNLGERQPEKKRAPVQGESRSLVRRSTLSCSIYLHVYTGTYLSLPYRLSALVPGKLICCRCLAGLFDALAAVLSNGCPVKEMSGLTGLCSVAAFFLLHFSAASLS